MTKHQLNVCSDTLIQYDNNVLYVHFTKFRTLTKYYFAYNICGKSGIKQSIFLEYYAKITYIMANCGIFYGKINSKPHIIHSFMRIRL